MHGENVLQLKVAETVIGEKTVVCGRSTRWWDEEIKGKIKQR